MAKPAKHNKAWSAQEIAFLKEHYRKGVLHREIAAALKRTLNAVSSKATELGLKKGRGRRGGHGYHGQRGGGPKPSG